MQTSEIRQLIAYNVEAHRRLWSCIESLTEAQYTEDVDYSLGSIHQHMVHVMSVDQRWMARVMDTVLPDRLQPEAFPTKAATRSKWDAVEQFITESVDGLTDADLKRTLLYEVTRVSGMRVQATNTVWQILAHIVNHGTDHRAQVLPILHRLGASTFEQDLMVYLWETHE